MKIKSQDNIGIIGNEVLTLTNKYIKTTKSNVTYIILKRAIDILGSIVRNYVTNTINGNS